MSIRFDNKETTTKIDRLDLEMVFTCIYCIAWIKWLYKKYIMEQEKELRRRCLTRMSDPVV